jgi:hypothetical protein
MAELYRVLPGGWALVSVPLRLDQPTYEDVTVTEPGDRLLLFGEEDHVRFYGSSPHRLEARLLGPADRADDLPETMSAVRAPTRRAPVPVSKGAE